MKLCRDCELPTELETDIWGDPVDVCECYGPELELRFDPASWKLVPA